MAVRDKKPWKPTNVAREIFEALEALGGEASTEEIARKTRLGNNGVSVTLGSIGGHGYIKCLGGRRNNARLRNQVRWKIVRPLPPR
jgi:hypothetical protein